MNVKKLNKVIGLNALVLSSLLSPMTMAKQQSHQPRLQHHQMQYEGKVRLVERVDKEIYGTEILKIRQLLSIDSSYRGKVLKKIVLVTQGTRNRFNTQLILNGLAHGPTQRHTGESNRIIFTLDQTESTIGRDIKSVKIRVRGKLQLKKVIAVMVDGQKDKVVTKSTEMYEFFPHGTVIPVRRTVGVGKEYNGKKVVFIKLKAESEGRGATAQLLINGEAVGSTKKVMRLGSELKFKLPAYNKSILGQDIRTIKLKIRGSVFVEELSVGLKKGKTKQQSSILKKIVDANLRGKQETQLIDLLQIPQHSVKANKVVDSVIITATSKRGRGMIRVCKEQSYSCDNKEVMGMNSTKYITRGEGSSLSEMSLITKGNITVETIIVKFKKR